MKLNKIERLKLSLKPYLFYEKIKNLNLSEIDEEKRFYLKNFGIYNTKLNPKSFMLRLRIPGGRIELFKLKKIVSLAKIYNANIILTARAQIELHGLDFESVLRVYEELEKTGITTWQTLSDNFRNIVTDPLDGVAKESIFETYPILLKMQELFLKKPSFVGMIPRKFNTAISANIKNISSFFLNDCYFALAKKDKEFGFNLYLGGRNLALSKKASVFVKKEDVVSLFYAIIRAYQKYGLRESRSKARLYHLLEKVGIETFKSMIKEFYNRELERGGELLVSKYDENKDWFLLQGERYAYRYRSSFGEIKIEELESLLFFLEKNSLEVRIGVDQNLYILGLKEKKFPFEPLSDNRNITVCAGSRYCIYSLFDTKKEASKLLLKKIDKFNIKVGYSGCLKGCGRHILADIGFVGIRTTVFGKLERGVRLYLGGVYTKGEREARLIYWAVPLRGLNKMLEIIIDEFEKSGFFDFESFSENILNNYRTEFLAFWFLAKLHTKKRIYLGESEENLIKEFKNFDFYETIEDNLYEVIKYLEKRVFFI